MERMYEEYGDAVEFRLVYITEAHATDSRRPVGYAEELGITEHKNYEQRCTTADMLLKDKKLTIPFVVDNMDNSVNKAYKAHPDRVFLVRSDGRLAVAAARGPWGFEPALKETKAWLQEFDTSGKEPDLPRDAEKAGEENHVTKQ